VAAQIGDDHATSSGVGRKDMRPVGADASAAMKEKQRRPRPIATVVVIQLASVDVGGRHRAIMRDGGYGGNGNQAYEATATGRGDGGNGNGGDGGNGNGGDGGNGNGGYGGNGITQSNRGTETTREDLFSVFRKKAPSLRVSVSPLLCVIPLSSVPPYLLPPVSAARFFLFLYCEPDRNSRRLAVPVGMPLRRLSVAVLTSAFLTVAGDASRLFWRYLAATPATCGAAIDVPLMVLVEMVLVHHADVMLCPGAKISTTLP
jgi:hypothetical protein